MWSTLFADLSDNNGSFDVDAYHAAGHIFIALKATEGTTFVDPTHRTRCILAHSKGLSVMHYHFARPDLNDNPTTEANHFLDYAGPNASGRDYLCVDIERPTPSGYSHDSAWSREFDAYIQAHSRFHTIIYANRSTLQLSDEWLIGDNKRAWVADWSNSADYAPPGYRVAARQFTDGVFGPGPHSLPGVGQCDVSALRGEFYRWVLKRVP